MWCHCELIQQFWRTTWNSAQKCYSSSFRGSKELENEWMSIIWGMAEQIAVHGDRILLC